MNFLKTLETIQNSFQGVFKVFKKIWENLGSVQKSSGDFGRDWNCSETFAGVKKHRSLYISHY